MTLSKCSEPGCKVLEDAMGKMINGIPFCTEHYQAKLEGELLQKFHEWDSQSQPPHRFLYLLGRVSDEFKWKSLVESYLTAARIRDRGFDFMKTDTGCTLKIVRHLNAQKQGYVSHRITESWNVDIFAKELALIGTRDFQEGDVDR